MNTPKFLKIFFSNFWITLAILLICIVAFIYYSLLPDNTDLTLLGFNVSTFVPKAITLILGLLNFVIALYLNLFAGALQKDKQTQSQTNPQRITINNEIVTPNDNQQVQVNIEECNKFYPNPFFPDLSYFEGRGRLLNNLKKQLDRTSRASIHDISGIGKTFSSYKFADVGQVEYEKIFFVRANKDEMLSSLAEMAILLNPQLKDEPNQSKLAEVFRSWLEDNENWLVIYDNVDLPEDLKPYVPTSLNGDCLFTSNFDEVKNLGAIVEINKLTKPQSKRLLYSRSTNTPHKNPTYKNAQDQKGFDEIINEIDGHPLALNTTGAFISKNRISFQKFAKKLENEPNIILENEDGFDNYQRKSVLKAFSIAIDDISETKQEDKFAESSILARKILNMVSFIAPEEIPEEFLRTSFEKLTEPTTFFQKLRETMFGTKQKDRKNEKLWDELRLKLFEYDLLKYNEKQTTLKTHRLVQKVIQSKLTESEETELLQTTAVVIDELFEFHTHETKESCELYTPHAIELTKKNKKSKLYSEEIARIFYKIGIHLRETIKYQESIKYYQKAIGSFEQLFNRVNENVATCLNNLAVVYQAQGRYEEAIEKYEEAKKIGEQTIGKEHPNYATRLNNLAVVYQAQGRYEEAIEKYEEAIKIGEQTIGKEHPNYAKRLNNLAVVYKAQGRYEEAIEKYEQAIKIDEQTIGKEHPEYAIRLNNLAGVYKAQGRYEEAIEKFEQAIKIDEQTIGKEHPEYAIRLNNLAVVYQAQGRYEEAIEKYEEAVRIFVESLGGNHPSTQTVKGNLEFCLEEMESKGE